MITDSFDNKTNAKINPNIGDGRVKCDACVVTFSNIIEEYVTKKFDTEIVGYIKTVNGKKPVYVINYNNKRIAFYKTILGAPTAVGCLEDVREIIDTDKYIVFGGAGCLDKAIARGKLMIPTEAYRDEGTSYHYAEPADYITVKNSSIVANFMNSKKLPYVIGKTWTTDAFYRETESNILKRKNDGCISVEMECSAFQAVCNFRGVEFYCFLSSGDLLDSPVWDERISDRDDYRGTQHDSRLFDIAIELADYVS
jgi:uridine phosphorylase